MPTIATSDGFEIFLKDWGSGSPIVFCHGWPLSSDDWDTQMLFSSASTSVTRSAFPPPGPGWSG